MKIKHADCMGKKGKIQRNTKKKNSPIIQVS